MTTKPVRGGAKPIDGRALAELLEPRNDSAEFDALLDEEPTQVASHRPVPPAVPPVVPPVVKAPRVRSGTMPRIADGPPTPPTSIIPRAPMIAPDEQRTQARIESLAPLLGSAHARNADEAATRVEAQRVPLHAPDESRAGMTPGQTDPSHPSATEATHAALAQAGALPRGTAVGRYLIVEPLGAGGLGDVYTAYDPELDRRVAVKLLRPSATEHGSSQSGTGSGRERLMREAKAMARLAHPNVVAVHDVGGLGDDVFIAMERVDGMTLAQWVRDYDRSWKEIREVFLGAGAGLAAAHAAKIIHRDFKPQNVVIGADGRPRVLDFGLARSLHRQQRSGLLQLDGSFAGIDASATSLDTQITLPGTIMGTPQFMAPEQFEGTLAGAPADQFSFCVAMWNALYRVRPFQADDMMGVIKAVREGRITDPKDRRDVPGWLHKVLVRGLARLPEERYPSMDVLLHAMQRDKRSRRRNWLALAFVGVLSAGGAGTAAFVLKPAVTDVHRTEVEAIVTDARAAAAKSYFVYPSPVDPEAVTSYRKVLQLEDHSGPGRALANEQAVVLREEFASTLTRLGDRYFEREGGRAFAADYYAAALIFEPDNETARERTTLTPGEISVLRDKAATGEFSAAELAAAASLKVLAIEDEATRVAQLSELFSGEDAPSESTSARLQALLGAAETEAIETATERKRVAKRAKTEAAKPAEPPPPKPVVVPVEPVVDPVAEAAAEAAKLEALAETLGGELAEAAHKKTKDPARAKELSAQGMAAFRKGQFDTAEGLFHRALGDNRRDATALGGLAEIHFERGSYQKALSFASQAVGVSPRSGSFRIVLGDAYFKTFAYESARREYEKAKSLGHKAAAGRLSQLDRRLGQ